MDIHTGTSCRVFCCVQDHRIVGWITSSYKYYSHDPRLPIVTLLMF